MAETETRARTQRDGRGLGIRLPFRIFGIPIELHFTFLIFIPVLAWIISRQLDFYASLFILDLDINALETGVPSPFVLGLIAAIGLFVGVFLHELGHSWVAIRYGIQIRKITLMILGGLAYMERMPREPRQEAWVAIAGPIVSFALGGIGIAVLLAIPDASPQAQFIVGYLGYTNLFLGLFNLIPAIPMDGGRVLRAFLARSRPYADATRTAVAVSRSLAILMGLFGLLQFNLFLMFIAFFIYAASGQEMQQSELSQLLKDVRVKDLMVRQVDTVPSDMPVSELFQLMLEKRHIGYPVVDREDRLVGIITLRDLQQVDGAGTNRLVEEIMTPASEIVTIGEEECTIDALEKLTRNNLGRLVVINSIDEMVGILSRTDLVRALQILRLRGTLFQALGEKPGYGSG
ncbi:MAG: site-2 protease family protein [Candidatus Bipolaricaulia bacterium]